MNRHGQAHAHSIPLATTGAFAIALGLALYALSRPARIPLIPSALHFSHARHESALLGSLPSTLHAFAMPLLTLACVPAMRRWHVLAACGGWFAVDLIFELAQRYRTELFPNGTFDGLDVLGACIGAALACAVALALIRSKT